MTNPNQDPNSNPPAVPPEHPMDNSVTKALSPEIGPVAAQAVLDRLRGHQAEARSEPGLNVPLEDLTEAAGASPQGGNRAVPVVGGHEPFSVIRALMSPEAAGHIIDARRFAGQQDKAATNAVVVDGIASHEPAEAASTQSVEDDTKAAEQHTSQILQAAEYALAVAGAYAAGVEDLMTDEKKTVGETHAELQRVYTRYAQEVGDDSNIGAHSDLSGDLRMLTGTLNDQIEALQAQSTDYGSDGTKSKQLHTATDVATFGMEDESRRQLAVQLEDVQVAAKPLAGVMRDRYGATLGSLKAVSETAQDGRTPVGDVATYLQALLSHLDELERTRGVTTAQITKAQSAVADARLVLQTLKQDKQKPPKI